VATEVPPPDGELNRGPESTPRPAATVILVRGGRERLEVLLVQRNPRARFMGGAWVFPGGAVDAHEGQGEEGARAAALRELAEEADVIVGSPEELLPFSRWITPAEVKTRFDTRFYLAGLPPGASPRADGAEVVDARWYAPAVALQESRDGRILLVFPTIKHLEQLARFSSADALLEHTRTREVVPIQPRVVFSGETARVVLPGEPGYEE